MGLYQRIFAYVLASGDERQRRLYGTFKRELFADLHGTIVELGPGTGVNLPYYPRDIRWVGIEPNPHMHPYIREKASQYGIAADLRTTSAAATGLPDAYADAVVSTLVLCSVPDLDATLAEVKRILKPGGRFYFIEHVAAPEGTWLRLLQKSVKPVWRPLADGCNPDRETGTAIARAGFRDVRYRPHRIDVPVVSPHIVGVATV